MPRLRHPAHGPPMKSISPTRGCSKTFSRSGSTKGGNRAAVNSLARHQRSRKDRIQGVSVHGRLHLTALANTRTLSNWTPSHLPPREMGDPLEGTPHLAFGSRCCNAIASHAALAEPIRPRPRALTETSTMSVHGAVTARRFSKVFRPFARPAILERAMLNRLRANRSVNTDVPRARLRSRSGSPVALVR